MESFKISTVTEQFPNQLAQGKGGKVRRESLDEYLQARLLKILYPPRAESRLPAVLLYTGISPALKREVTEYYSCRTS